jgi:hypothetical protein
MTIKQLINSKLYEYAYRSKGRLLNSIPNWFLSNNSNLSYKFQIGITTYVDRYETFFKPLYYFLRNTFPDISIYVAVNGFHDPGVQTKYLERFHNEICACDSLTSGGFILHDKTVGLTRLWNEILSLGSCKTTLILNDDLKVYPWFKKWLENEPWYSEVTLINGSWSHFFICKGILNRVGWFDEEFQGIGFEDMDYTARCVMEGIMIGNLRCQNIIHLDHQPTRTSFDDRSETLWGPKYSTINHDRFFDKWKLSQDDSGIFIKQLNSYVVPNNYFNLKSPILDLVFHDSVCYPDR